MATLGYPGELNIPFYALDARIDKTILGNRRHIVANGSTILATRNARMLFDPLGLYHRSTESLFLELLWGDIVMNGLKLSSVEEAINHSYSRIYNSNLRYASTEDISGPITGVAH